MLNFFLSGGLKLMLYLFIIAFICGAKTHSLVRELANLFSLIFSEYLV